MAEKEKVYVQGGGAGTVIIGVLLVAILVALALYFTGAIGPQKKTLDVNVDVPKVESPAKE